MLKNLIEMNFEFAGLLPVRVRRVREGCEVNSLITKRLKEKLCGRENCLFMNFGTFPTTQKALLTVSQIKRQEETKKEKKEELAQQVSGKTCCA